MLIFGGTFERHPTLRVIIAEGGIGWLAYYIERMDHVFAKQGRWAGTTIPEKPSFYFARNILATFEEDQAGMRTYDLIGFRSIMWSSDYPHSDSTWPRSQEAIEEHFGTLPEAERRAMVCDCGPAAAPSLRYCGSCRSRPWSTSCRARTSGRSSIFMATERRTEQIG